MLLLQCVFYSCIFFFTNSVFFPLSSLIFGKNLLLKLTMSRSKSCRFVNCLTYLAWDGLFGNGQSLAAEKRLLQPTKVCSICGHSTRVWGWVRQCCTCSVVLEVPVNFLLCIFSVYKQNACNCNYHKMWLLGWSSTGDGFWDDFDCCREGIPSAVGFWWTTHTNWFVAWAHIVPQAVLQLPE